MVKKDPKKPSSVTVRQRSGKYFINMEDLLNHPSFVRDDLLPKYKVIYVTRFNKVVLEIREPDLAELGIETEEF